MKELSPASKPASAAFPKPRAGDLSSRRQFLYGLGATLGSVAFSSLLAEETNPKRGNNPLSPKAGHFPARARRCIFLVMEGGPSHIDTFDPKPKLAELHLKQFQRYGKRNSAMETGRRYYVQSPFSFGKYGQSGADMSVHWKHLQTVADEICFYRGCQVDSVNHPTAQYQLNTSNRFGGDPAIGAWTTYGLGTLNQNLPGYIVLPETAFPQGGSGNWTNGFLPAGYQGVPLRPQGTPILDLQPPDGITPGHQKANLKLLQTLNESHRQRHPWHQNLAARMDNYELAFRMQAEVPGLLDISQEDQRTLEMYGIDKEPTDHFGRKCLLARRFVEKGVRFVQCFHATWDSHDFIERAHGALIPQVDQPIAALIRDLRDRGLLDETLVIWGGEFGRSPDNGIRGGIAYGRDHNPKAMTFWLAGGGVNAGHTIGATDEIGATAVSQIHPIRDLHVTILRLLGLDDNRLTFFHAGRFKQLSQFGGQVIRPLLA